MTGLCAETVSLEVTGVSATDGLNRIAVQRDNLPIVILPSALQLESTTKGVTMTLDAREAMNPTFAAEPVVLDDETCHESTSFRIQPLIAEHLPEPIEILAKFPLVRSRPILQHFYSTTGRAVVRPGFDAAR